jgi:hypothetical protein
VLAAPADVDRSPVVVVFEVMLGSQRDTTELLDSLVARVGVSPVSTFAKHLSSWETLERWARLDHTASDAAGVAPPGRGAPPGYHVIKSEFFGRPLPADAIAALVGNLTDARVGGQSRELDFSPWGGAYNRVPADATAFVHRDPLFSLKHAVVVEPAASTAAKQAAHRWATRSWAWVHRGNRAGVPQLRRPRPGGLGRRLPRRQLRPAPGVRARYDPGSFFHLDQSPPVR